MNNLFLILGVLSFIALPIGLIRPKWIHLPSRERVLAVCGGLFISSFILFGVTLPKATPPVSKGVMPVVSVESKVITQNVSTTTNIVSTSSRVKKEIVVAKNSVKEMAKPSVTSSLPSYVFYSVIDVVDGDTVKINMNGKIETLRLIGMDTPETLDPRKPVQCFGKEASSRGKESLLNKRVRIEADPTQDVRDKYSRLLAYVFRDDGLFYNKQMIEQGYAHEYTYSKPYKYQTEFKQAQTGAINNKLGLWSPDTCNGGTEVIISPTTAASSSSNSQTSQQTTNYYTSSHYSAKYYYPANCEGWKSLSTSYLKSFNTLDELLSKYSRTVAPTCN